MAGRLLPRNPLPMPSYDPELRPEPLEWLQLPEEERIGLVAAYHRDAHIPLPKKTRLVHAALHAVVENQLAEHLEPVVDALVRLLAEGLSRHEAIHAIGFVLIGEINDSIREERDTQTIQSRYGDALERLTAASWRDQAG